MKPPAHIEDSDAASDTRASIVLRAGCFTVPYDDGRKNCTCALAQLDSRRALPLILRSDFLPAGRVTIIAIAVRAAGLWEHEEVGTV